MKERTLTAEIWGKHVLLFLYFDLFCSWFWIFFSSSLFFPLWWLLVLLLLLNLLNFWKILKSHLSLPLYTSTSMLAFCSLYGLFFYILFTFKLVYFLILLFCFSYCSFHTAVILYICITNQFHIFLFNFVFLFFFFLSLYLLVCFASLLYFPVSTLFFFSFLLCVLVSFIFNWSISFLVSLIHQVNLLYTFFKVFWL